MADKDGGNPMKNIFPAVFYAVLSIVTLLIVTAVATFFIAIFNPEGVIRAIEIFKGVF